MINRQAIECKACGTTVITRTAVGHGAKQTHCYPCPECGVVITFSLLIDQKNVQISYEDNPSNGVLAYDDRECAEELAFDSETLGLRSAPALGKGEKISRGSIPQRLSPFMETVMLHRKPQKAQQLKVARIVALERGEHISRILSHVGNDHWDLVEKEFGQLGKATKLPANPLDRLAQVRALLVDHQEPLIEQDLSVSLALWQGFTDACHKNASLTDAFCDQYRTSKRLLSVWRQLVSFRNDFLKKAYYAIPILQARTLRKIPSDDELHNFVIYNKQYDELKTLYIDGFELLARLTVLLLAFHGIADRGSTDVPTKKGGMSIWNFEGLANANKSHFLLGTPGEKVFVPYLDTTLRNGVGHNQAHYDGATDEVVIYKQDDALLNETRISYTLFVMKVMRLCSTLLEADALVFHVLERTSGRIT